MKITYNPTTGHFLAKAKFSEKEKLKRAGFRWDPEKKQWWTNSKPNALKLASFFDESCRAMAEEERKKMEETFSKSNLLEPSPGFTCPSPTGKTFFPHQLAAIEFSLGRKNTLIADQMGVGKTASAIGVINCTQVFRVLILCPASLKLNWRNELQDWITKPTTITLHEGKGAKSYGNGPIQIHIANYDILGKLDLKSQEWDLLILDECHYLKNPKSSRRLETWGGRKKIKTEAGDTFETYKPIPTKRTLALTGTPVCNRPSELWTLLRAMDSERWTSNQWEHYHTRYCDATKEQGRWDVSGASNLEELNQILRGSIMIRRLKEEVLKDLPPKIRKTTKLETNREIRDLLDKEAALQNLMEKGLKNLTESEKSQIQEIVMGVEGDEKEQTAIGLLAKIRRRVGEIKAPIAADYAKDLLEGGVESLVIMAHHKSVVETLEKELKEFGVVKVVGGMSGEEKQKAVEDFQSGKARVFIGSITAAGVGITLTKASHTLFVEVDWVPGNLAQAEDRTHRHGQKNCVIIEYLVFEGSIDQTLIDCVENKQLIIDQITK